MFQTISSLQVQAESEVAFWGYTYNMICPPGTPVHSSLPLADSTEKLNHLQEVQG